MKSVVTFADDNADLASGNRRNFLMQAGTSAGVLAAGVVLNAATPVKAAAAIIHLASLDEPPLRLLLGSDAVHLANQNDLARMEADRTWRDLSVSTDFESTGGPKRSSGSE